MNKYPYPALRDVFNIFLRQTFDRIKTVNTIAEAMEGRGGFQLNYQKPSLRRLCHVLGITESEFGKRYWEPWQALSPEQAIEVALFLNMGLIPEKGLFMELKVINGHQSLQWTLANVYDTKLFEMFIAHGPVAYSFKLAEDLITEAFLHTPFALPYQQCRFCGRLDYDPRGKRFNQRQLSYCHTAQCPSDPNPGLHPPECCYGNWKRLKNNLRATCKRFQSNPDELQAAFLTFCQNRYQANLKIQTPVRVEREKPREWQNAFDQIAFTIHEAGKSPPRTYQGLPLF